MNKSDFLQREINSIDKEIIDLKKNHPNFLIKKKIKKLEARVKELKDEVKNTSLFILKNRLTNSIIRKIIPNKDYFEFFNNSEFHYLHREVIKRIENKEKFDMSLGIDEKGEKIEPYDNHIESLKNVYVNLELINLVLNKLKDENHLDDDYYEFLYEETGFNLFYVTILTEEVYNSMKNIPKGYFEPYDKLKLSCFGLFTNLDDVFFKINKRSPKNLKNLEKCIWD